MLTKLFKPLWYDWTDHSRRPRTITMYSIFAAVVLAILVFSTIMFQGTSTGRLVLLLAKALTILAAALVLQRFLNRLWKNIPYTIQVLADARSNRIEVLEFRPSSKRWWSFISEWIEKIKIFLGYHRIFDPKKRLPRRKM